MFFHFLPDNSSLPFFSYFLPILFPFSFFPLFPYVGDDSFMLSSYLSNVFRTPFFSGTFCVLVECEHVCSPLYSIIHKPVDAVKSSTGNRLEIREFFRETTQLDYSKFPYAGIFLKLGISYCPLESMSSIISVSLYLLSI